jgi:uncharacterized protein
MMPFIASAQDFPTAISPYVNDYADLIDPETEARIASELEQLRRERSVEMTVATISNRTDYGPDTGLEPFATALFNDWGIGKASLDNGILFLISSGDRETRIELGAGFPPEYDDRMKTIIDHTIIPFFRQGQFSQGIESGVLEIIKRTDTAFVDQPSASGPSSWLNAVSQKLMFVAFAAFIVLLAIRRRLTDTATKWRRCPTCGHRSLDVSREREAASGDAQGMLEHRHIWCTNCDYRDETVRRIVRNRHSGSSSGGGFGGGRSSGGGASGRW